MKKVISTVTAMAFILGLAGAGLAQTAVKEAEKPAVKVETTAPQTQAAPVEKEKAAEKATQLETKKSKKAKEAKKKAMKKTKKAVDKPEHPAAAPSAEPKQETK
jgi:apolipoprotein N-acyltransferase